MFVIFNAILDAYPNFIGLQICLEYKLAFGFKKLFSLEFFLRLSQPCNDNDKPNRIWNFVIHKFPYYTSPKRKTSRYYNILTQEKSGIAYLHKEMAKQRSLHLKLKMTMVTSLIQEEKILQLVNTNSPTLFFHSIFFILL